MADDSTDPLGPSSQAALEARATPGLHTFLATDVLPRYAPVVGRAVDLGAGSGALAQHLSNLGWDVTGVDREATGYRSTAPLVVADLNRIDLPKELGHEFDLVLAVEVIEHLEAPIAFLRTIRALLDPKGTAIVTTPNMESLAGRMKFLFKGKLRMMDEWGDPTHISPIFRELLIRQYLPRASLDLVDQMTFPRAGYVGGRPVYRVLLNGARRLMGDRMPTGDKLRCGPGPVRASDDGRTHGNLGVSVDGVSEHATIARAVTVPLSMREPAA